MKIKDDKHAREIIQLFKDSYMLDRYPYLKPIFENAKHFNEWHQIENALNNNPALYRMAKIDKAQFDQYKEDDPFFPEPYKQDEFQIIYGPYSIGMVDAKGNLAGLFPIDLTRGLFICGESGGGKTYAILLFIKQMLSIPIEQRNFNIIIIQVVKRDADFLIKDHPTLRIIEYENLRYNMWLTEDWDNQKTNLKKATSVFADSNWLKTMTQPILKKSVNICVKNNLKPTFTIIDKVVNSAASSLKLGGNRSRDYSDAIRNRISEFIDTEEILDGHCHYPIDEFWSKEDIILNLMDEPNSYIYRTIVSDLLITLQRFYGQNKNQSQINTLFVIDECRGIFPKTKNTDDETGRFLEQFITTSRSSGIGRITITQEPESVQPYLTTNSAFHLAFPIAGNSIDSIKKSMTLTKEQIEYIPKLDKYGEGIFRDRRFDRPYIIKVPPDLDDTPIDKNVADEMMKPYITGLIEKYTNEPKPVKIRREAYSTEQISEFKKLIYPETKTVLVELNNYPTRKHTDHQTKISVSRKQFMQSIDWLIQYKFVKVVMCKSSKTRPSKFYALTPEGFLLLGTNKNRKFNARLFKHSYYCYRVAEYLKEKHLKPIIEYRPDSLKELDDFGRIDVFCISKQKTKYANEITLSFSNYIGNIRKCILADMDVINIICENKGDLGSAIAEFQGSGIVPTPKVTFKLISEYL